MGRNTIDRNEAVRIAEDAAEEIVPFIKDRYDVDLHAPEFVAGYEKDGHAMTHFPYAPASGSLVEDGGKHYGRVKVRKSSWSRPGLYAATAHELAHAAVEQNSHIAQMYDDEDVDWFTLKSIDEGIAQYIANDYMRNEYGKGSIRDRTAGHISRVRDTTTKTICDGILYGINTVSRGSWDTEYSRGRKLFRRKNTDDIASVIQDVESFYQQLV